MNDFLTSLIQGGIVIIAAYCLFRAFHEFVVWRYMTAWKDYNLKTAYEWEAWRSKFPKGMVYDAVTHTFKTMDGDVIVDVDEHMKELGYPPPKNKVMTLYEYLSAKQDGRI